MKKNLFLIFAIAFLASCNMMQKKDSGTEDQKKIQPDYNVTYDNSAKSGSATISFGLQGHNLTSLNLSGKSTVSYNGQVLVATPVPIIGGFTYDNEFKTYTPTSTFVYTDNDGKVYTNTFTLPPINFVGEISQSDSGSLLIKISRGPVAGETIDLDGDDDSLNFHTLASIKVGELGDSYDSIAQTFTISREMLSDYTNHFVKLQLVGTLYTDKLAEVAEAGGTAQIMYRSEEKKVDLKK